MRIFVASWFFPPVTTSEGIVAYKLLRNSRHQYDVCSSLSRQWTYHRDFSYDADNITVFPIETDDFDEWIDQAVELFETRHHEHPYDAIMSRSMPPESVDVAKRIRENHPDIPWIASLADPIGKMPYETQGLILDSAVLSARDKADFIYALHHGIDQWRGHWNPGIQLMCQKKDLEDYVITQADAVIMPHETMRAFVLDNRRRSNTFVVPHSFDRSLYPKEPAETPMNGITTLTYIGHTDALRSLEPLVRAVMHVQKTTPEALDHLRIRFIGNVPQDISTLVFSNFLHNVISIEGSVDYLESLAIMQQSDWLIHVDASFDFLEDTGGSIFFAGKLADYMGTSRPILAITGKGSPADTIVTRAGGLCFPADDIVPMAQALIDIAQGRDHTQIDADYRAEYDARKVAGLQDAIIDNALDRTPSPFTRDFWPDVQPAAPGAPKLLTICVPSYNVEAYLDRCLFSMVSCDMADRLEVLVINDGSPDNSRQIALAYQEHYPSVVRLIDKENGGHGSTVNTASEAASGRYFRVVDGDDWLDSRALDHVLGRIDSGDLDADLISSDYLQVFAGTDDTVAVSKQGDLPYDEPIDLATADMSEQYFSIHSIMVKTDVYRQAGFKLQEHTYYVDVEYMLCFIPYVRTVEFTSEPLYRYTVGNAEQSINPDVFVRRYDQHDRVVRRMVGYFADWPAPLPEGHMLYIRTIFARYLLKTHFELSLIMDPDKQRGAARAQDFDAFLSERSPWLYRMAGILYRGLRQARHADFNPRVVKGFRTLESGTLPPRLRARTISWGRQQVARRLPVLARVASATPAGRRFLASDFALRAKRSLTS